MGPLSIGSALASLKAAGEIAQSFLQVRDTALIQGKVIELQSVILAAQRDAMAAQGEQSALLERVRELEQQIVQLKDWEAEKQRYELNEVGKGAFVYSLKESMKGAEPDHWLCTNCYQQGRKSILQRVRRSAMHTASLGLPTEYECPAPACKAKISFAH